MHSQLAANSVGRGDFQIRRGWLTKSFRQTVSRFGDDAALHFLRQENFLVEFENKIHFFLVAFPTDFYSQARWRERPQSMCE